jgi:glycosyltransferase involved in cell wall biosynthesis
MLLCGNKSDIYEGMMRSASELTTVSIITPSFNQGHFFLSKPIESAFDQQGDFNIEYTIVDRCSIDDSLSTIEHYESPLHEENWPVKCQDIVYWWVREKVGGPAEAVSKGLRLAQGEIIGCLNSDDKFFPDVLTTVKNESNA